jgi:hypothetical protein
LDRGSLWLSSGVLENVAHSPPPRTQPNAVLEAATLSGAGSCSSIGPFHDDASDLVLDMMVNVIAELEL